MMSKRSYANPRLWRTDSIVGYSIFNDIEA